MGLFGKLFEKKQDKKYCDICGSEIKLLVFRNPEDGSLCSTCAEKLSPWLEKSECTTVDSIREHLRYREENRAAVENFQPTRILGSATRIMIDEDAGTFLVAQSDDWRAENPDIVPLAQIADVGVDVRENRVELKQERKNAAGKTERVSFIPPRYKCTYSFWVKIRLDPAFRRFGEICFNATEDEIALDSYNSMGRRNAGASSAVNPYTSSKYRETDRKTEELRQALLAARAAAMSR